MYEICDVHSHVLPGMDDGCKTPEESLAVLKKMWEDGIRKVFATPHYYAREPVDRFLARREESVALLRPYLDKQQLPALCCGAEVAYFPGIGGSAELSGLCLGKSKYLLLELPFTPWNGQVARDLDNLCLQGYSPILAHFERYVGCQTGEMLQRVLEPEPLVQMNAGQVLDVWKGAKARKALQRGAVQLLGSDCHGLEYRPARLGQAVALLEKKKLHDALSRMELLGNEIFREACGNKA